jgi:outer membrane protein OmpA-like peptidoglycan-associated protein
MNTRLAIAATLALATLATSGASIANAAEISKEGLIRALTAAPIAKKLGKRITVQPGAPSRQFMIVEPEGNAGAPETQQLVINPDPVPTKKKKVAKKLVEPQGTQTTTQQLVIDPAGAPTKTKRIAIAPKPVGTSPKQIVVAPKPVFTADKLRSMASRRIVVEERTQIAAAVEEQGLASVDMEIYFAYNSAALEQEAFPALIALGQALSDQRLAGGTFVIAGHTDATGGDYYNQTLSERRAWSVKTFLVQTFHLDPDSLLAVGYGEEQLKDWYDPASGVNRRVQVVNVASAN